jgi:hypothetical protein
VARRKTTPPSLTELPSYASDGTDFGEWVEDLSPAFLGCRDFGHVWRAITAGWDAEHNSFVRTQRCQRCKTNRTQYVGRDGTIDGGNKYEYPEGYKTPAGSGLWDRDQRAVVRLASTLKMIRDA